MRINKIRKDFGFLKRLYLFRTYQLQNYLRTGEKYIFAYLYIDIKYGQTKNLWFLDI